VAVVFVSSDRDIESFAKYYGKMPFLAIPPDVPEVKQNLSDSLKIQGIPTMIVLDAKTGNFVTDSAKEDVSSTVAGNGTDGEKAKAVIASWKAKESIPISQANFGGQPGMLSRLLSHLMKNPAFMFALFYFGKKIYKIVLALGKEREVEGEL
jgi:nucleoredoxin